ncbi:MAG TPA: serine/threonine-protein kinase [Burkholderiales bacterium]|nr:serine/threonine-protein kinase [Burkholderiales bacterium]
MISMLGRYEILAELGQGAMGTVYKARDPLLDRIVAIKTVNLNLPKDEVAEYEARFYQEAKAAGQLSHRNIVTIYDVGKSDRLAYMAMELLQGQELRTMLGSRTPIPVEQALEITAQVADGLQYAHDRQVIHRDIKPANIMVCDDGLVKITDFGIARMRNNAVKTQTGMILGSPKYMSPEQVAGRRADTRSDLFSLGVVLYEMLTGTSPFVADNIHGVMYQTINFNPPAPKTLNPELPDVLNFIVAKALAKNLDDRYATAKGFSNDLREARAAVLGVADNPSLVASRPLDAAPFVTPSVALTRQEDRRAAVTGISESEPEQEVEPEEQLGVGDTTSSPALPLSKAFDSFDATMRLAALTGMEKELDQFSETQKIARLKALSDAKRAGGKVPTLSDSTTWQSAAAPAPGPRRSNQQADGPHLRYVWIASVVLAAAAGLLLLLR